MDLAPHTDAYPPLRAINDSNLGRAANGQDHLGTLFNASLENSFVWRKEF